jgi:hypothetical protein
MLIEGFFAKKVLLILLILYAFVLQVRTQSIIFSGTISDEDLEKLSFANIIIKPQSDSETIRLIYSNNAGEFQTELTKDYLYDIVISYLGYQTDTFSIFAERDIKKHIILKVQSNVIDIVEIKADAYPIVIKEDTTIYNVVDFTTGNEQRLKDIISKLPGLEVDAKGGVYYKGNRVKKIYIENNPFFGGNSKMAVEYFPANAVEKIEVHENYNEVAFRKDNLDDNDLAINVKLKANKKELVFGELSAGTNLGKRYKVHPNIFYYTKHTNINFIGDINNIGTNALTFEDIIQFEGGISKFMQKGNSFLKSINNSLTLLPLTDFVNKKDLFGGLNLFQKLSSKIKMTGFSMYNDNNIDQKTQTNQSIVTGDNTVAIQDNIINERNNARVWLHKVTMDYIRNNTEHATVVFSYKNNAENRISGQKIKNILNQNFILQENQNTFSNFNISGEYHKKITEKYNASIYFSSDRMKNYKNNFWSSEVPLFQNIFSDETYKIYQNTDKMSEVNVVTVENNLKINRKNRIKAILKYSDVSMMYHTLDKDSLNKVLPDYKNQTFANSINQNIATYEVNVRHLVGTSTNNINYGVNVTKFNQNTNFPSTNLCNDDVIFQPVIELKSQINKVGQINLNYSYDITFPDIAFFQQGWVTQSFNTISSSTPVFMLIEGHRIDFGISRNSMIKGHSTGISANFFKSSKGIVNQSTFESFVQTNNQLFTSNPLQRLNSRVYYHKKNRNAHFMTHIQYNYSDQLQSVNGLSFRAVSSNITHFLETRKSWKLVEITAGNNINIGWYNARNVTNKSFRLSPYLKTNITLSKNIKISINHKSEFIHTRQSGSNLFHNMDGSLDFSFLEKPLSFHFEAYNVFNQNQKIYNFGDSFFIIENQVNIQPRIILFSLKYKF